MPATTRTSHFHAPHPVAQILVLLDRFRVSRDVKARPSAARIELRVAAKEHRSAARAHVLARFMILREYTSKGPFCPLLAKDMVLLGGQQGAPLGVTSFDL